MASNLIQVEDHRFYRLTTLSYKLASLILRKIICQYCSQRGCSFKDFLNNIKHELFHLRHKTLKCCRTRCQDNFGKVLLEPQWGILFTQANNMHGHAGHSVTTCSEMFTAKDGITPDVCDVLLASSLITNIKPLSMDTFKLMYINDDVFKTFLLTYQHKLFHLIEKKKCCQCTTDPESRNICLNKKEWDSMFNMLAGPRCNNHVCSCKYTPIQGISVSKLEIACPDLISKLLQIAGAVIDIRTIRNDVLAHSSDGTLDDRLFEILWKNMSEALSSLLDIIRDDDFRKDVKEKIRNLKICPIDGNMLEEFNNSVKPWISDLRQTLEDCRAAQKSAESELQITFTRITRQTMQESRRNNSSRGTQRSIQTEVTDEERPILISYADHDQHRENVRAMAGELERQGYRVIDLCENNTDNLVASFGNKHAWMRKTFKESKFIIFYITQTYLDLCDDRGDSEGTISNHSENRLLTQFIYNEAFSEFYDNVCYNRRFIPVVFPGLDRKVLPPPFNSLNLYDYKQPMTELYDFIRGYTLAQRED